MAISTKKSKHVLGSIPTPTPIGKEVVHVHETMNLLTTDMEATDIVQFFTLPAGCVPVSYKISSAQLAASALAVDFGLLASTGLTVSAAAADGGKWLSAAAPLTTATLTTSDASKTTFDALKSVVASSIDRIVGFVVTTVGTTPAAGDVTLELSYKAAN